jgi:hypothetical protein
MTEPQPTIILETTKAVFELRIDMETATVPFYWCWRRSTARPEEPRGDCLGPFVSEASFRAALLKDPFRPAAEYDKCIPPPNLDWMMQ